jgi:putative peptidoglycan lipid II flippase
MDSFAEFLRNGLRRLMFIALPASTLLILLSQPIIWILFRHGKYTPEAAQNSALAFAFYCVGMFAWDRQQLLARALYALQDTVTPTIIGSVLDDFLFHSALLRSRVFVEPNSRISVGDKHWRVRTFFVEFSSHSKKS